MKITNETEVTTVNNIVPDNWIYIQERDVKLGRLQIFNNWSPYMVKDLIPSGLVWNIFVMKAMSYGAKPIMSSQILPLMN